MEGQLLFCNIQYTQSLAFMYDFFSDIRYAITILGPKSFTYNYMLCSIGRKCVFKNIIYVQNYIHLCKKCIYKYIRVWNRRNEYIILNKCMLFSYIMFICCNIQNLRTFCFKRMCIILLLL